MKKGHQRQLEKKCKQSHNLSIATCAPAVRKDRRQDRPRPGLGEILHVKVSGRHGLGGPGGGGRRSGFTRLCKSDRPAQRSRYTVGGFGHKGKISPASLSEILRRRSLSTTISGTVAIFCDNAGLEILSLTDEDVCVPVRSQIRNSACKEIPDIEKRWVASGTGIIT